MADYIERTYYCGHCGYAQTMRLTQKDIHRAYVPHYCVQCKDTKPFYQTKDRPQAIQKKRTCARTYYRDKVKKEIEEKIAQSCAEYKLGCRFVGTHAYISTSISEWFFDYTQEKINLYHASTRRYVSGITGQRADYHQQNVPLFGWRAAITYIRRHDKCYYL